MTEETCMLNVYGTTVHVPSDTHNCPSVALRAVTVVTIAEEAQRVDLRDAVVNFWKWGLPFSLGTQQRWRVWCRSNVWGAYPASARCPLALCASMGTTARCPCPCRLLHLWIGGSTQMRIACAWPRVSRQIAP